MQHAALCPPRQHGFSLKYRAYSALQRRHSHRKKGGDGTGFNVGSKIGRSDTSKQCDHRSIPSCQPLHAPRPCFHSRLGAGVREAEEPIRRHARPAGRVKTNASTYQAAREQNGKLESARCWDVSCRRPHIVKALGAWSLRWASGSEKDALSIRISNSPGPSGQA